MPHRPRPRGYEAIDIYLRTQESAVKVLGEKAWTNSQVRHIEDFDDYNSINKETLKNGQTRFREKQSGRFVKGY